MEERHHFKISRYCPKEEIFDGMMTFTEARKFMDENATFERPDWLGEEVTGDPRYYNSMLMKNPFKNWK